MWFNEKESNTTKGKVQLLYIYPSMINSESSHFLLVSGHIDSSRYLSNMWKEIKSGFLSATVIATIICVIGTLWAYADDDNVEINKT